MYERVPYMEVGVAELSWLDSCSCKYCITNCSCAEQSFDEARGDSGVYEAVGVRPSQVIVGRRHDH